MADRTLEAVRVQIEAMHAQVFEVGLYKPNPDADTIRGEMLPRSWDVEGVIKSVLWLKFQNRDGRNIYVRPKGEHSLSLVDDLSEPDLRKMTQAGFAPALIIETSPKNFQAWLHHGRVLPKDVSSAAARALAERFGGDLGCADWRHYGRMAGFTNRKPKHQMADGRFPFVQLVHASGEVYRTATDFLREIQQQVAARQLEADRRRAEAARRPNNRAVKNIDDFRGDPRYAGDGNRIDMAYAVYALSRGVSEDRVREAIATRDLGHKGNSARQTDYIERTLAKAARAAGKDGGLGR